MKFLSEKNVILLLIMFLHLWGLIALLPTTPAITKTASLPAIQGTLLGIVPLKTKKTSIVKNSPTPTAQKPKPKPKPKPIIQNTNKAMTKIVEKKSHVQKTSAQKKITKKTKLLTEQFTASHREYNKSDSSLGTLASSKKNSTGSDSQSRTTVTPPRMEASHLNNPAPAYPRRSRQLNEQGTTVLSILILKNGRVGDVSIKRSSGFKRLDKAAIKAVSQWRYQPAKQGSVAIDYRYTQALKFTLN